MRVSRNCFVVVVLSFIGTFYRTEDALAGSVNKGIVLIDRTGSMMTLRDATNKTRCSDALDMARTKVDQFFSPPISGTSLAIWTFNGTSVAKLTGYVTSAAAKSAINSLSPVGCSDSTPLADAICQAIDDLSLSAITGKTQLLTILSDGGENNSSGVCKGSTEPYPTPGSWRINVFNYAVSKKITINQTYFTGALDIFLRRAGSEIETPLAIPLSSNLGKSSGLPMTTDPDHEFLLTLTIATGGTYELMKDSDTDYPCSIGSCPPPYYEPIIW